MPLTPKIPFLSLMRFSFKSSLSVINGMNGPHVKKFKQTGRMCSKIELNSVVEANKIGIHEIRRYRKYNTEFR